MCKKKKTKKVKIDSEVRNKYNGLYIGKVIDIYKFGGRLIATVEINKDETTTLFVSVLKVV